jgi:hypothetical protein
VLNLLGYFSEFKTKNDPGVTKLFLASSAICVQPVPA